MFSTLNQIHLKFSVFPCLIVIHTIQYQNLFTFYSPTHINPQANKMKVFYEQLVKTHTQKKYPLLSRPMSLKTYFPLLSRHKTKSQYAQLSWEYRKCKKEIGAKDDCRIATCDDSLKVAGLKKTADLEIQSSSVFSRLRGRTMWVKHWRTLYIMEN